MTRDRVIAMAREAGIQANVGYIIGGEHKPAVTALKTSVPVEWLESFAALVAAKAAADEREACARVVRDTKEWRAPGWVSTICPITKESIAAAIRARGQS